MYQNWFLAQEKEIELGSGWLKNANPRHANSLQPGLLLSCFDYNHEETRQFISIVAQMYPVYK